jgi:hypothetical protein
VAEGNRSFLRSHRRAATSLPQARIPSACSIASSWAPGVADDVSPAIVHSAEAPRAGTGEDRGDDGFHRGGQWSLD